MTNKEKFLKLVCHEKTNTIERAKYRLAKNMLIMSSYEVVMQRCSKIDFDSVISQVDFDNGWCQMFDSDGILVSPCFKKLNFGYEYCSRKIDVKEYGMSAYWRPKTLNILK